MNSMRLLFVTEYIKNGGNAEHAARAAGFSEKYCMHKAYLLPREEEIATLLARAGKRIEQKAVMDGTKVVKGLIEIASADITTFMRRDDDGNYIGRAPHELTPAQRRVIKTIHVRDEYGPKDAATGQRPVVAQRFKYEVHDKFDALMALAKVYGTFADTTPKAPSITLNMFAGMSEEELSKLQSTMQAAIEGQFTQVETENGALLSHD
jgi:phage terminase small subunit